VRAVWVTFDRGRDIMKFYSGPDIVAFARRHDFVLMMPHQCPERKCSWEVRKKWILNLSNSNIVSASGQKFDNADFTV
jgi:hypothetical protein